MAGKIPRDFIDDLLARTDVVDIVDSRVKLKKAGKNYQACCPFHDEKTPSFTVSQDKQFYHCFGCGAHGNAISFMMEYDRLDFVDAIEELARHHGLDVPRDKGGMPQRSEQERQQQQDDYALMEQVSRFYQQQLRTHKNSQTAIDYLKSRGLSGDVVKQWEIGYAPDGWDAVLSAFGSSEARVRQLIDLKLVNRNDRGKQYDFFRDRIMFPIRDRRGRVIGFGGRILEGDGPKYLNSPETRIFHKGRELYGYYQAQQQNRQLNTVMVVEGYMDVVALSQFGITNATAALGTATTPEHIQMLARGRASQIAYCFDGDRAGRDAAWRALENALPALKDGTQLSFLFLPDGEDPDTMVRKVGQDGFVDLVKQAMPLSQFFFDALLKEHNVGTPEGRMALKSAAQPLIEQVDGDEQRLMLEEELAKHTKEYDRFRLQHDIKQANSRSQRPGSASAHTNKPRLSPLRMMVRLLVEHPNLASQCPDINPAVLTDSGLSGMAILVAVHQYCHQHPTSTTAQLIENFRSDPHSEAIGKLLNQEHLVSDDDARQVYQDSFAKLLDWHFDSRIDTLLSRARVQPLTQVEKQELNLLMKERQRS